MNGEVLRDQIADHACRGSQFSNGSVATACQHSSQTPCGHRVGEERLRSTVNIGRLSGFFRCAERGSEASLDAAYDEGARNEDEFIRAFNFRAARRTRVLLRGNALSSMLLVDRPVQLVNTQSSP